MRFHHVAIQVKDLPLCERFYTEVLGLPVLRRDGARSVWLGEEGHFIALERCDGAVSAEAWESSRPGLHLFALAIATEERESWEARFRAHGVEVVRRTRWTLYVRDPEGNRIGLSHRRAS